MLAVTISTVLWLSSGANLPANKPINAQDHATQAGAIAKTSSNRHVPSHVPRDTQSAKKPHVMMILLDDFGWSEVSWHRNYTIGGLYVPPSDEVVTPNLEGLLREGIELDRTYVFKCCSPTRSAVQSGRNPIHVNVLNAAMEISNPADPDSGYAGVPRSMTGLGSKMLEAGYHTAIYGKWDAGMATYEHTPHGRGYIEGIHYFHHDNDYWSQSYQLRCNGTSLADLWRTVGNDASTPQGPAFGWNSTCVGMMGDGPRPDSCSQGPKSGESWWGGYEDAILQEAVLRTVQRSVNDTRPLFLFWAPHATHAPLQAPAPFIDSFSWMVNDLPNHNRQNYKSMVKFTDESIGNVTAELKSNGMFEDTLIILLADNGGWSSSVGVAGGNNYPLTGGKYNNWEGGIRVNSFVSGGFIPPKLRGTKFSGLIAGWDWYATLCAIGGVSPVDTSAAKAGLPAVDSIDMSPWLLGATTESPRKILLLGTEPRSSNLSSALPCTNFATSPVYDASWGGVERSTGNCTTVSGVIVDEGAGGLWKLVTGAEEQYSQTGPTYPNASTTVDTRAPQFTRDCNRGCLFNLLIDPMERHDLAEAMPTKVLALTATLNNAIRTAFNPDRGTTDPRACSVGLHNNSGFWGPFDTTPMPTAQ